MNCPCGAGITTLSYDTSRSITFIFSDRTEAPLTQTCERGHEVVSWVEVDYALELIREHQTRAQAGAEDPAPQKKAGERSDA